MEASHVAAQHAVSGSSSDLAAASMATCGSRVAMEIVWLLDRGCVSSSATASVARVLVVVNLLYRNTRSGLVAGLSAVMVAERVHGAARTESSDPSASEEGVA
mmetsp:Transcript_37967/g.107264  ORF Transcript_37967/g.107264 Transcript_37967/m.107264 type:complete len:103 (-) Transcript_37967:338-646(-)|eukprot:CAMPEP_0117664522 /NCGR_PEP_ID=MMETSP0804-20121206/9273_1 /TAXON_ID=1074897 /ORGANISM="Tetraselmis astigmatica, Strain CCMP880" /LENGTH=102 /DNA_ID=CAMNT_0005471777 /DNA_START=792 /DNA_END=1100 /DNA_ORIENTATION=+